MGSACSCSCADGWSTAETKEEVQTNNKNGSNNSTNNYNINSLNGQPKLQGENNRLKVKSPLDSNRSIRNNNGVNNNNNNNVGDKFNYKTQEQA